jgi:hypothetical protein
MPITRLSAIAFKSYWGTPHRTIGFNSPASRDDWVNNTFIQPFVFNLERIQNNQFKVQVGQFTEAQLESFNYMSFINGGRRYFAFITDKTWLNEGVVRYTFEVDVLMTYLSFLIPQTSFIERRATSPITSIYTASPPDVIYGGTPVYNYIGEDWSADARYGLILSSFQNAPAGSRVSIQTTFTSSVNALNNMVVPVGYMLFTSASAMKTYVDGILATNEGMSEQMRNAFVYISTGGSFTNPNDSNNWQGTVALNGSTGSFTLSGFASNTKFASDNSSVIIIDTVSPTNYLEIPISELSSSTLSFTKVTNLFDGVITYTFDHRYRLSVQAVTDLPALSSDYWRMKRGVDINYQQSVASSNKGFSAMAYGSATQRGAKDTVMETLLGVTSSYTAHQGEVKAGMSTANMSSIQASGNVGTAAWFTGGGRAGVKCFVKTPPTVANQQANDYYRRFGYLVNQVTTPSFAGNHYLKGDIRFTSNYSIGTPLEDEKRTIETLFQEGVIIRASEGELFNL